MSEPTRGRFVWHELITTDIDSAKEFYPRVFGWGVQEWQPGYSVWTNGERMLGGLMELPPEARATGAPPYWLAYTTTPDVDATVAQAKSRGARVLEEPSDIPTVGRWALLKDPQGVTFAPFTPAPREAPPAGPPPGAEFSWHELGTSDQEAAFEFYAGLFGWERIASHDMGAMGTYIIFGVGGEQMGGMYRLPPDMGAPPHWLHYIHVPSADETAERIKANGGRVVNGPMEVPGGDRVVIAGDPQDVMIAAHSSKP